MNKKGLYILIGSIIILVCVLCVAIIGFLILQRNSQANTTTNTVTTNQTNTSETNSTTNTTNSTSTDTTATEEPQTTTFENDYMKFTYPNTWEVAESTPSAINIVNNQYILFINTQASQASGVTGGRFSEISMGSPGADLVIKTNPAGECGTTQTSDPFTGYDIQTRVDLYVSSAETSGNCNTPTNGKDVWYFSYVTNPNNYYFNYYVENQPKSYVITMTYNTSDVNNLPVKGSAELNSMLSQMTDIVKTLQIKQQ